MWGSYVPTTRDGKQLQAAAGASCVLMYYDVQCYCQQQRKNLFCCSGQVMSYDVDFQCVAGGEKTPEVFPPMMCAPKSPTNQINNLHHTQIHNSNRNKRLDCYSSMASETTPLTANGHDSAEHLRRLKSYQW